MTLQLIMRVQDEDLRAELLKAMGRKGQLSHELYIVSAGHDYEGATVIAVLALPFSEVQKEVERRLEKWPGNWLFDFYLVTEIRDGRPVREQSIRRGKWQGWEDTFESAKKWWAVGTDQETEEVRCPYCKLDFEALVKVEKTTCPHCSGVVYV